MTKPGWQQRKRPSAQSSEHKWAEWQRPPVLCGSCGKRVTLKQAFFASVTRGTFHAECAPYKLALTVTFAKL